MTVLRVTLSVAAALALSGCAGISSWLERSSHQQSSGVFVGVVPAASDVLATDVVEGVSSIYSPAKTHLVFAASGTDAFSTALISRLRAAGFAVSTLGKGQHTASKAPTDALTTAYLLDDLSGVGYMRFRMFIGGTTLARAYQVTPTAVSPAGAWVRTETAQ